MKELEFSIRIHAARERVWTALWADETFRDWAGIIDEGTYMKGSLAQGSMVEFISAVNGFGVTSLVEQLRPAEYIRFRHRADSMDMGQTKRAPDWAGGRESYALSEEGGMTTLTLRVDVPVEHEDTFRQRMPVALARIKVLAEENTE